MVVTVGRGGVRSDALQSRLEGSNSRHHLPSIQVIYARFVSSLVEISVLDQVDEVVRGGRDARGVL